MCTKGSYGSYSKGESMFGCELKCSSISPSGLLGFSLAQSGSGQGLTGFHWMGALGTARFLRE